VSDGPDELARGGLVQSVDRALSIMEILARDGWSGVSEMARELDVHRSTVSRLLGTLERRGIVEQHPASQKYRLGFAIVRLADGVRGTQPVTEVARPTCERLSMELDETVNLAVLDDGEVVNIDQTNLSSAIIAVDWVGHRGPLHATASGKVFLAFGAPVTPLAEPLERVTRHTLTDLASLRADLALVRQRGYSVTEGELEEGLNAVAAPVRDAEGEVVAAIVVSGPEYRVTAERIAEIGGSVGRAAAAVSHRLGWVGPGS
jgi:DNA-binding IclR family transcriptional regulator